MYATLVTYINEGRCLVYKVYASMLTFFAAQLKIKTKNHYT